MKDIRMVHTAGVDLITHNHIRLTVSIPTVKSSVESQGSVVIPKLSGEGHSVQEASMNLQKVVSQHMDLRETRILLVNRKFAEHNLYEGLDFFYREAHYPVNVYIAVTDSSAQDIVQLQVEDRSLISEYLYDLLISSEEQGLIPNSAPYLIMPVMATTGIDNVLPYIRKSSLKDRAMVDGVALFHDAKMTGHLNNVYSKMFVMFMNTKTYGSLTEKIGAKDTYNTFMFRTSGHHIKLNTKGRIQADLYTSITCELIDNPSGVRIKKSDTDEMERQLEQLLTKRAEEMLSQLQQANCDGLGIGQRIKGMNDNLWKKMNWNEQYPHIKMVPHIEVKIENHGLLN
ncbi:Ger(x)C family spore germination protein [Paenibacillus swuensis]